MTIPHVAVVLNWRNHDNKSGLFSVYLRITIDRVSRYFKIPIPKKITIDQWSGSDDCWVKPNHPFSFEINHKILEKKNIVYDLIKRSYNYNKRVTFDMIFTQPVLYEFSQLKMPVLLVIGQRDRTAPGSDAAPADVQPTLGKYPKLGRQIATAIPNAKLVELEGLGHMPHIEAFPRFIQPLRDFLTSSTERIRSGQPK